MTKTLTVIAILLFALAAPASETVKGAKKDYEAFKTEMSAKMDAAEKNLDVLKEKSKTNASDAKKKTVENLEVARVKIRKEMADLGDSGEKGWKKAKKSMAESIDNLNAKIQKAMKD